MHIAEVVTIAKSLPLLRLNTYKSLILSYSADYRRIFRKKFVSGYQFMRIIKDGEGSEVAYRIDWKDVVLLLENPVIKSLKIR